MSNENKSPLKERPWAPVRAQVLSVTTGSAHPAPRPSRGYVFTPHAPPPGARGVVGIRGRLNFSRFDPRPRGGPTLATLARARGAKNSLHKGRQSRGKLYTSQHKGN
eukprot:scaffold47353_cov60-Phaeocystis_antarctica.AAC.1